jgi:hypothetical protein
VTVTTAVPARQENHDPDLVSSVNTPYHHYWVAANKLSKGEHLRTADGTVAVAEGGITPKDHDGWMWDLTVPGNNDHDFYVEPATVLPSTRAGAPAVPVLVHNNNDDGCGDSLFDATPYININVSSGIGGHAAATADGAATISGWELPVPPGVTHVDPQAVLDFQEEMGFPALRSGALDQGVPGRYLASHAERKMSLLKPNAPIEEGPEHVCDDCILYFQRVAVYRGVPQEVTDPFGTHTFNPDGTYTFSPKS